MGSWLSTPWDPSTGISDLTGKVAVVTGANTGIGYATTLELARHGAKVYLGCRSEAKAHAAIEQMHAEGPGIRAGALVWLPLDLMDLDSVAKAAEQFMRQEDQLDVLVNNAGVATLSYQTTPAGFEVAMGVNHLAHFLLTTNLLATLRRTADKKGSDVRVVNVSSSGHSMLIPSTMRFDKKSDLQYHGTSSTSPYSGRKDLFSRYAVSKLANILFTTALQRRYKNVLCASCNPGGTNTAGGMSVWPAFLRPVMSRLFVSPAVGARPVLLLAAGKDVGVDRDSYRGVYVGSKCTVETPSQLARDADLAESLWKLSEEALAEWIKK